MMAFSGHCNVIIPEVRPYLARSETKCRLWIGYYKVNYVMFTIFEDMVCTYQWNIHLIAISSFMLCAHENISSHSLHWIKYELPIITHGMESKTFNIDLRFMMLWHTTNRNIASDWFYWKKDIEPPLFGDIRVLQEILHLIDQMERTSLNRT